MRRSCRLATLQARTPSPCAPHVYPLTLAISMLMGSSSGSTVMELGMSTTLSYLGGRVGPRGGNQVDGECRASRGWRWPHPAARTPLPQQAPSGACARLEHPA